MTTAKKPKSDTAPANVPFAFQAYSPEQLREVLRRMYLIRRLEEGAEDAYTRGSSTAPCIFPLARRQARLASACP